METMDIIIYAAIAAFLAYRLWSVLGQREDGEDTRERPNPFGPGEKSGDEENVLVLEGRQRTPLLSALTSAGHAPTSLAGSLDQMKILDPSFDEKKFLEGAKLAFKNIVASFAAGDLTSVTWLLGPEVLNPFTSAISERKANQQSLENSIEKIVAADIVAARLEGSVAVLTIEFISHQVNLLKDAEGRVLDGEAGKAEEVRDMWVFRRDLTSPNPNWQLVETRS